MACVVLDSENYLLIDNTINDIALCDYLIYPPEEYTFIDLSSADITSSIGFGFGVVTFFFLLGFAIKKILRVINLAK